MIQYLIQILFSLILIILIDKLLISALKTKWFYEKQGIYIIQWHPFQIFRLLLEFKKSGNLVNYFKEIITNNKQAKGFLIYRGFEPIILLNKPDQIKDLTSIKEQEFEKIDSDKIRAQFGPGLENIIFGDLQHWKKSRKLFHNFFSFQNIKQLTPKILEITKNNLQHLKEQKENEVYLMDVLSMISGQTIFSLFCGFDQSDLFDEKGKHLCLDLQNVIGEQQHEFRTAYYNIFWGYFIKKLNILKSDRKQKQEMERIKSTIEKKMIEVIDCMKKEEKKDNNFMFQVLPQLEELRQNPKQMVSEFMMLFIAGTDTTSHVVHNILLMLLEHPEEKTKLLEEINENMTEIDGISIEVLQKMKYMDCVIKETLRLNSPAIGLFQRQHVMKNKEVQLGDLILQRSSKVGLFFFSTMLDSQYFSQPFHFLPQRWLTLNLTNPHVYTPFSIGSRSCLGEKLSLLEIKIILIYFLSNFHYSLKDNIQQVKWALRFIYEPQQKLKFNIINKN